jgi:predicted dienelactone hydrolase
MRVRLLVLLAIALGLAATGVARAARVGVRTLTFTKSSVTTGAPRTLATEVWYPAAGRSGTVEELGRRDAKVRRGHFPLIVFSHGTCGRPSEASYLTMALASRGFVVAAPSHPGNTADDFPGCLGGADFVDSAANRVPDVRFVIDTLLALNEDRTSPFGRRLRPEALGVSGLSFGGFTSLLAAQQEPRLVAALSMVPGGTVFLGRDDIAIPAMVIGAERDQVVGYAESPLAYARLAGPRFLVKLLAANHLSVVDSCINGTVDLCVPEDISQDEAHRLVLRYALPFFDRYLKGKRRAGRRLVRAESGVELQAEP